MASTATPRNRLNKQGSGDNVSTWGGVLNTQVFDLIDEALDGVTSLTITGNVSLSTTNYATDQSRKRILKLSGSPGATYTVTIPNVEKFYLVHNATNAPQQVKASGVAAVIPASSLSYVYCDGVDSYTPSSNVSAVVGAMIDFAGSAAPSGWLMCGGQEISRATYSALFQVIGTTYGNGNGSSTFNVPDLRGRVAAGKDNMGGSASLRLSGLSITGDANTLGSYFGSATITLSVSQLPAHAHSFSDVISNFPDGSAIQGYQSSTGYAVSTTQVPNQTNSTGGGSPAQIAQPSVLVNKIIYSGV